MFLSKQSCSLQRHSNLRAMSRQYPNGFAAAASVCAYRLSKSIRFVPMCTHPCRKWSRSLIPPHPRQQSRFFRGTPCHRPCSISIRSKPNRVSASNRAWNLLSTKHKNGAPGYRVRSIFARRSAIFSWSSSAATSSSLVLPLHAANLVSYSSCQSVLPRSKALDEIYY